MTPEQREALIEALVVDWRDAFYGGLDNILDDILVHGRIGYADFTDEELVDAARVQGLFDQLEQLGIRQ